MEIGIDNNQLCAKIPTFTLCSKQLSLPVQEIFSKYIAKHTTMLSYDYQFCDFVSDEFSQIISCSSFRNGAPDFMSHDSSNALEVQDDLRGFKIQLTSEKALDSLSCTQLECNARSYKDENKERFNYNFFIERYTEQTNSLTDIFNTNLSVDSKCLESYKEWKWNEGRKQIFNTGLCKGMKTTLFNQYLLESPVILESTQSKPARKQATPPDSEPAQTQTTPPDASNSQTRDKNPPSFPYMQVGLGAAGTIYFTYKAYKETRKIYEESLRKPEEAAPRLKAGTKGHAASKELTKSNERASGWRALGYAAAAIGTCALTAYTIKN